jgi:hypothetical protein
MLTPAAFARSAMVARLLKFVSALLQDRDRGELLAGNAQPINPPCNTPHRL